MSDTRTNELCLFFTVWALFWGAMIVLEPADPRPYKEYVCNTTRADFYSVHEMSVHTRRYNEMVQCRLEKFLNIVFGYTDIYYDNGDGKVEQNSPKSILAKLGALSMFTLEGLAFL